MGFEAAEPKIPEGSLAALFTDGLVEHRGRATSTKGFTPCAGVLTRLTRSLEVVCDTILETLSPDPDAEDVALLLIRAWGLGQDSPNSLPQGCATSLAPPSCQASTPSARASTVCSSDFSRRVTLAWRSTFEP